MRGISVLAFLAMAVAMPVSAADSATAASRCAEVTQARARLATDRQAHQNKLAVIERGVQARRVRYQLRTELLRAQLRKQHQSGVYMKPEQGQQLIASEKLAREMSGYSAAEAQQIEQTRQSLSRIEGNYQQKHGSAWTECPRQAAALATDGMIVADR